MEVTPARLRYWASMKGKSHGHKTNNDKHWTNSPEFRKKMREIALADGRKPDFTGRKHTQATKNKMSENKKSNPVRHWLGKDRSTIFTEEYRRKMSVSMKKVVSEGKHNLYIDGRTPLNKIIRCSMEYKLWREAVFRRDDYRCQKCGTRGGKLEADHDLPFSLYTALRFEVLNGQTLCRKCHKETDTYGRRILSPLIYCRI